MVFFRLAIFSGAILIVSFSGTILEAMTGYDGDFNGLIIL